jgi:hypothetical protein
MVNIMRLAHPDAIRPVDGIDFIWQEIHNGVIERRSPAYAPYLHRFFMSAAIEHWADIMSGRRLVTHELHTPTVVSGPIPPEYAASVQPCPRPSSASRPLEHGSKRRHHPQSQAGPSTGPLVSAPPQRGGVGAFFRSLFSTCHDARAYSHDAREFAKEGRRLQNADRRAQGLTSEVDPPELAPTAFVDILIPDVPDADWFSYFGGGYGGGSDAGFGGASAYAPSGDGGSNIDPQGGPHDGEASGSAHDE